MTSSDKHVPVYGPHGLIGTIERSDLAARPSRLYLTLTDGRQVLLRPELLTEKDGAAFLAHDIVHGADHAPAPAPSHVPDVTAAHAAHTPQPSARTKVPDVTPAAMVVPVAQEEFDVAKRVVEDVVRVTKSVHHREAVIDPTLLKETVDVERVRIDKMIDVPATIRQEGDVTVIPVMEEVYVVEKRLMLREEVRLTKRQTEVRHPQKLDLRYEEVVVERVPNRANPSAGASTASARQRSANGATELENERV